MVCVSKKWLVRKFLLYLAKQLPVIQGGAKHKHYENVIHPLPSRVIGFLILHTEPQLNQILTP